MILPKKASDLTEGEEGLVVDPAAGKTSSLRRQLGQQGQMCEACLRNSKKFVVGKGGMRARRKLTEVTGSC